MQHAPLSQPRSQYINIAAARHLVFLRQQRDSSEKVAPQRQVPPLRLRDPQLDWNQAQTGTSLRLLTRGTASSPMRCSRSPVGRCLDRAKSRVHNTEPSRTEQPPLSSDYYYSLQQRPPPAIASVLIPRVHNDVTRSPIHTSRHDHTPSTLLPSQRSTKTDRPPGTPIAKSYPRTMDPHPPGLNTYADLLTISFSFQCHFRTSFCLDITIIFFVPCV